MSTNIIKLSGNVGFSSIPDQVYKYAQKNPFILNILVVGESGLGKSTVMNNLFGGDVYPAKKEIKITDDIPTSIQIQNYTCELTENNVSMRITLVDALGYADLEDNTNCWETISKTLESRLEAYYEQETRVNRKKIVDNRIHCCLFFISPSGHTLKQIDIETMRSIHERIFIIPIIAKGDTLTPEEREAFKKRVLEDLEFHKIKTFSLDIEGETDPNIKEIKKEFMKKAPFSVIAGDKDVEINGKMVKGRKYPWGVIDSEDLEHSDLGLIRDIIIGRFNDEVRLRFCHEIYESYRRQRMPSSKGDTTSSSEESKKVESSSPFAIFEEQKKKAEQDLIELEKKYKQDLEKFKKEKQDKIKDTEKHLEEEEHDYKIKVDLKTKEKLNKEKSLQEKFAALSEKDKKKKK